LGGFATKGVVCSANDMPGSSEPSVVGLKCDEKMIANKKFDGKLGS